MKFHRRCGDRVTLLHDNTTAVRNFVEFNHGLILSAEPLPDDVIFEVCIDRKVNVWNGSLEIGVTTQDPEYMDLPATATKLRNTAWIMSGCSVVKDGVTLINEYGPELDSLHEGEIVGVMRSSKGELSFYVNGRCLGVAAEKLPGRVFAVIDLYGQCVQVTIVSHAYRRLQDASFDSISSMETLQSAETGASTSRSPPARRQLYIPLPAAAAAPEEGDGQQYNNDWQVKRDSRETNSESSGSGDPDQDVMSDRCTDEDSREDRYESIARGVRDAHLDSNLAPQQNREEVTDARCRVGMLYDWHLDQLTPYTGDTANSQFDNSLSEVSEAGLTSEESEAIVDEVRPDENRVVETVISMPDDDNDIVAHDKLRFHPRCGFLVKISPNFRSAERSRPLDDYNNGVVMTHRPLCDNELFEIRIDRLVDKWSGSIEMGVTHHNPATIRYPSTMTNMESGTIMMSGCKVLLNGHGTCLEYGNVNLDELREGDRVGVVRRADGSLHYVVNGADQGAAAERVAPPVWGVVDLYGMTVKVTIVDTSNEPADGHAEPAPPPALPRPDDADAAATSRSRRRIDEDSLLFHTLRDSHVTIINDGKTAHRPNAFEYFHNGVVTTNRSLKANEVFVVRLDRAPRAGGPAAAGAGGVEIGVTQHPSSDLKFPFRISNTKTGTWVLAGEDVIQNGNVIIPKYVRNLNRLKEGDTVGVVRRADGMLHFLVNGVDLGPAACNVPDRVFGIVDLYGRVAQVSIVDAARAQPFSPESLASSDSNATVYPEMCFHRVHGRNARLSRTRLTASRTAVYSEFNDAVLFSSRPLRECDMFELRIDGMVDCWIGSLEIGVTAIRPEDFEANGSIGSLAGTATDLNCDTYILSGAAMMKDGECVKSGYPLDLDTLTVGSRVGELTGHSTYILSGAAMMVDGECVKNGYALDLSTLKVGSRVGMMWHADRSLHYYLDGMDMGKAWYVPHLNIYAVVDLYGQCTQVTLLQNEERTFNYNGRSNSDSLVSSRAVETPPPPYWSFSEYCGDNVKLTQDYTFAKRLTADPNGALVFSSAHLAIDEVFEIKVAEMVEGYAGGLRAGVTDVNILNAHVNRHMPPSVRLLPHYTAYIDGRYIRYSKPGGREQEVAIVTPSFDWLRAGDRVGLKKAPDGRVLVYLNGDLLDACFENVPDKVYVVIEIYGRTSKIQAVSKGANVVPALQPTIPNDEYSGRFDLNDAADPYGINNETDIYADQLRPNLKLAEPEASEPEEMDAEELEVPLEPANDTPMAVPEAPVIEDQPPMPTVFPQTENVRKRPYTFHSLHGKNIKLLGSDTVAMRQHGYQHGVAVLSHPLTRGQSCWFRVDKLDPTYSGTISVGAIPYLPIDPLPSKALDLPEPSWILSSDFLLNEFIVASSKGRELEDLGEGHAVCVHFKQNGDVEIEIDRKQGLRRCKKNRITLGLVKDYTEIYPLIDVYGKVLQVSTTIYPHYFVNDPASITVGERQWMTVIDEKKIGTLVKQGRLYATPTSRCIFFKTPFPNLNLIPVETYVPGVKRPPSKRYSLVNLSTYSGISSNSDITLRTFPNSYRSNFGDEIGRQSENEGDYLDSEIIKALTLESKDLPDLSEEQTTYFDISKLYTRSTSLSAENLNYIKRILCPNQEGVESSSLEAEWESSDGCSHLQTVLKYWKQLSKTYPQLRSAVSWGQIKCYCSTCEPTVSLLSGWVRIERIDGVGAARTRYARLTRAALAAAADGRVARVARPPSLARDPDADAPPFDMWLDEGKPYVVTIAIEIDTEGSNAENDRLLAILLCVRPAPAPCVEA